MKNIYLVFLSAILSLQLKAQNVGIGTITPKYKLEVNGSLKVNTEYLAAVNQPTLAQTYTLINADTIYVNNDVDSVWRFYDPGGVAGNYLPNMECCFRVAVNLISEGIELLFENVELGTGDSIILYEGYTSEAPILARLGSGNVAAGFVYQANSSYLFVRFKSNSDLSIGSGFSVLVKEKFLKTDNTIVPGVFTGDMLWFDSKIAALRSGKLNTTAIKGRFSTAMGDRCIASGWYSTALGMETKALGSGSIATGWYSTASSNASVAMGFNSIASGGSSVAMGSGTTASGNYSTAMGYSTDATGVASAAIGYNTTASGDYSTAMGYSTEASGSYSTAMGSSTTVSGSYSTVMGRRVILTGDGSFAIGDNSVTAATIYGTDNRMYMRFANGYRLYTEANSGSGVQMNAGGNSWATISDYRKKENYLAADGKSFLNKISNMQLGSWNYIGQDKKTYRHYGPMAQEFYKHFGNDGIGNIGNDTTIATADIDGVMMIAIQALVKENEEIKLKNKNLEVRLQKLEVLIKKEN